uniref:Site-specific integrase n=1 Tax=Schlesneria paludicola TaxID=360056 RepID=A0A7C2NT85_9PLAN
MASVCCDPNGLKRVLFTGLDRRRRTIRLGKCPKRDADTFARHVENILSAARSRNAVEPTTADWLGEIPDAIHEKLVAAELVKPRRNAASVQLGRFLDSYLAKRADLKGGTRVFISHTIRNLKDFFGSERPLGDISAGDADEFGRYLVKAKLAPATVCRRLSLAKSLFRAAVRHKLIAENPFADAKTATKSNPERQRYIDRETITKIIDAAPDAEWRLLIALARFGGVRVPSEAVTLRWCDVNWTEDRLTIRSPKTEHIAGKASRQIPLFAELRPFLEDVLELVGEHSEFVFDKLRRDAAQHETGWKAVNLRTQFTKIIGRAGFKPWPRLWVNLRSSCETDLVHRFPAHVTAAWLGHTPEIAQQHYLQVLPAHFAEAAQKAAQSVSDSRGYDPTAGDRNAKTPANAGVRTVGMGGTGFEPVTSTV